MLSPGYGQRMQFGPLNRFITLLGGVAVRGMRAAARAALDKAGGEMALRPVPG
jgi:hypothetical protein